MAKQKEETGVFKDIDVYPKRAYSAYSKDTYWQRWKFNPDNSSATLLEMELFLVFLIVSKNNHQPYLSFPHELFIPDYRRHFYHLLANNLLSTKAGIQLTSNTPNKLGITEKAVRLWYKDKEIFSDFMNRYLRKYESGGFDGAYNSKHYSSKQSLRKTINLLKSYYDVHGNKFTIRAEWEDVDGNSLKIDPRTRIKEDLLLLENKKLLSISRVSVDNFEELCVPRIVIIQNMHIRVQIELLKPIEEFEKEIFEVKPEEGFLGLFVNEDNEVFYKEKKIKEFSSSADQQIGLLNLLIEKKGVAIPREAVYSALKYTTKSKKAPKRHNEYDDDYYEREGAYKRGPKISKREAFRDRLKKLIKEVQSKLPDGSVIIKNTEKEGVFLVSGETKVSRK